MDANMNSTPRITKETKRKIKADFERTPLKDRLKAKFVNLYFFQKVVWYIFRLVLLIGISYVVLYPFFTKIAGSFMSPEDFVDVTVRLIPKHFTLDIYKAVLTELKYFQAFRNTLIPLVTIIGGSLPGLFSGALITETLFSIPGIGYISYQSMVAGDIPFTMFYLSFMAVLTLVSNLLTDIMYAVVDPRVRIS